MDRGWGDRPDCTAMCAGSTTDLPWNENSLLARWRAGDRVAGDELLHLYRPMLCRFFRRRTNENVEELVQDTLVACIRALHRFEGRSSFRTFLLGIAHRQFLMSLRSKRASERLLAPEYTAPR